MPERDVASPAPDNDLDLLIDAARAAGEIALSFADSGARSWDKPDDQGPVTEADLAVNHMLQRELRAARPDYGWLSEESPDDLDRLSRDAVFIIDPIDGTRAFMKGDGAWSHSLAVARGGRITAAVVFLPVSNQMFAAARGTGAQLNGETIRCSTRSEIAGASLLAARPNYDAVHWRGAVPAFERVYRPSLAYRLSLVAQGRFDAMITLRPSWEWDIAAGSLIVEEAGAVASSRAGSPLSFNNPKPLLDGVVAAGPALHQEMVARLAPAPETDPGLPPRRT